MADCTAAAPIIRDFLNYHENILNHSLATVDAYFLDLKQFVDWLHLQSNQITMETLDLETLALIKKSDIYEFLSWLTRVRKLSPKSRARRLSTIKSFYRYLTVATELLVLNPTASVEMPKLGARLPVFLTEEQSKVLSEVKTGEYWLRDQTILNLFLSCGLRISELVGLDLEKVHKDNIVVLGKGNKERMLYLPEAMQIQLRSYLDLRYALQASKGHESALFLSREHKRISVRRVQSMVDEKLRAAGLDAKTYSPHKLRHTAATLLMQHGVDVRVLQEILGHESLETTQIYTHVDDTDRRLAAEASPIGKHREALSKAE